jgi:pimeloyl-ACP methyl ester carboxylesterase
MNAQHASSSIVRGTAALMAFLAFISNAGADALPRRLDFGWVLGAPVAGAVGVIVKHVSVGGSADRAGVRAGDMILKVGEATAAGNSTVSSFRFAGTAGRPVDIRLLRATEHITVRAIPRAAARESHVGIETEWGVVAGPGGLRLRSILTLPPAAARRSAVYIVGWLSCDSVEIATEHPDSTALLIQDIVEHSGSAVFRLDKPGVGDSEGVCSTTDFATELEGYRRAFAALRADARINPKRIVVVGISNGGGFAPLVPGDAEVAGYIAVDGWSKTWFEHMIDLERRRLVLSGTQPAAIGPAMAALSEFHAAYLFDQLTPAEVLRRRPQLAGFWYDGPDSQYGRPAAFYHQLQRLDLAAAWARVRAPTLVVWGEYDWIMDRADQEQIVQLVNGDGVQRAALLVVPGTDHNFGRHPDRQTAFDRNGDGIYPPEYGQKIVDFIRKTNSGNP